MVKSRQKAGVRAVELFDAESSANLSLIKTDDDGAVDVDHWNTHLSGLIDHLLALLEICCDVKVLVIKAVCLKEVLGHVAIHTCRGRVNCNSWHMKICRKPEIM